MNKFSMQACYSQLIAALAVKVLFVVAFASQSAFGQSPTSEQTTTDGKKVVRELYVPFPNLDTILENDTNRVFISRKDYLELKRSARQIPAEELPHQSAVLSAVYDGTIRDGRLFIRGELTIDALTDSLQALSLEFANLGIRTATLDGSPARLAMDDQNKTVLFLEGAGTHQLVLEMIAPVAIDAAQQSVVFQVPTPPSCKWNLSVPGNVEIKSGASVIQRSIDESAQVTTFQLVPQPGRNEITMSLNNRMTREQNTVMARGVVVAEVTQAYERFHATMAMDIVNGAASQFRFELSDELDVSSVQCEGLNRWETTRADGKQQLVVHLRSPSTDPVVIKMRMERGTPTLSDWQFPKFAPIDVASYSAVIGLVTEDRIKVGQLTETSLFTIDSTILIEATAESMFVAEPGAPRVNAIAAYYATDADFALSATLDLPEPTFRVNANSLFQFSDSGVSVSDGMTIRPLNQDLFSIEFLLPAGWDLNWVRGNDNHELQFDRFVESDAARIRVRIPGGVRSGESATIWFDANHTPADWLGQWQTQTFDLPSFDVPDASEHQGVVAIVVEDDLVAKPTSTAELVLISESEKAAHNLGQYPTALAYQYVAPGWTATVELERIQDRQTARVLTFVGIESESIRIHGELIFLISDARSRTLSFSLPENTPTEIAIRALDGVQIKDTSSEVKENRRVWTVELAQRHSGRVRLSVDFMHPLDSEEPRDLTLPVLRSENVDYQTGAIALEGHAELATEVNVSPRTIDIGELADAEYQVGKRLIGVYGYVATNDALVVDIARRPILALPTTIVQRAEIFSSLSAHGRVQSAARYTLRTKATMIECVLPEGAELWSVLVDDKPALPQRIDDRLMIAIPADLQLPIRDLKIVYSDSISPLGMTNDAEVAAPQLFQRGANGNQGSEIPIADQKWKLQVPTGFQLTQANGRPAPRSGMLHGGILRNLEWLGGGYLDFGTPFSIGRIAAPAERRFHDPAGAETDGALEASAGIGSADDEFAAEEQMMEMMGEGGMGLGRSNSDATGSMPEGQMQFAQGPQIPAAIPAPIAPVSDEPVSAGQAAVANAPIDNVTNQARSGGQNAWQIWALEGVRSLPIHLDQSFSNESIDLGGLGGQQETQVTIVNMRRLRWFAWTLAALVFSAGLTIRKPSNRFNYLFLVTLCVILVPAVLGLENELGGVQTAVIAANLLLLIVYLVRSICRAIRSSLFVKLQSSSKPVSTVVLLMLFAVSAASPGIAQNDSTDPFSGPRRSVASPADVAQLIESLGLNTHREPVVIPQNAVVIPYTPGSESASPEERVLVPYKVYQQLLKSAESSEAVSPVDLPKPFAWSDVSYSTTLDNSGNLRMVGTMTLEQFESGPTLIPLSLSGCVIESATLDGQPAKLRLVNPEPVTPEPVVQQKETAEERGQILALYSKDQGTKQFEIVLGMKLRKSGGWRIADGRVPSAAACSLRIKTLHPATEVRVDTVTDRARFLSERAEEVYETAFPPDGRFSVRWRDQISEATIDRGLTAESKAIFDIREDSLRMTWQAEFQFRRGRRETLTMSIPSGYLIETVLGDNVRGWTVSSKSDQRLLDVELLKAAVDEESITVILSKQHSLHATEAQSYFVPNIVVPDAMLQQGRLTIRTSEMLDIDIPSTSGLSRIDVPDETQWFSALDEPGPIPIKVFQSYRYAQNRYELPVKVSMTDSVTTAKIQSLLKISERNTQLESRLVLNTKGRPLYRLRVKLPNDLDIQAPQVPGDFQWSLSSVENSKILVIQMADGQLGEFSILLNGELPVVAGDVDENNTAAFSIPKLEILDIENQSGSLVVQPDPAFDVRATDLVNCDVALRNTVRSWLTPQQRSLARSVIAFRDANYSGTVQVSARTAYVSSLSVTNVKVTDRAVEETIYIEATITSAGIQTYSFLLPESLAAAKIEAPLIRQKTIQPIDNSMVRVTLELQDSILGRYAIIVQSDRLLGSGIQSAPIPTLETGKSFSRIVTLENASRDELIIDESTAIESIDRAELNAFTRLKRLSGKSSLIFRVKENSAKNTHPSLTYQSKTRETIVTSDARIGLAQTLLVVDQHGTYRGRQEYRVENRTEPYLEVSLPENARLWTVQVSDQSIKPTASKSGSIRIPLIKTAEGDLDYGVVLKYGGQLTDPGRFNKIQFPLLKTININVELSQVRLRLPGDFRWLSFDSTMKRVLSDADLQAGWLSFRTKQISELTSLLSSRGGQYSKMRAKFNLKQLEQSVQKQSRTFSNNAVYDQNQELQKKLQDSSVALRQANEEIQEFEHLALDDDADLDNRFALGEIYQSQSNTRARNVASALGRNFSLPEAETSVKREATKEVEEKGLRFDQEWLKGNQLAQSGGEKGESRQSRIGKRSAVSQRTAEDAELGSRGRQTGLSEHFQSPSRRSAQTVDKAAKQQIAGDYRAQVKRYSQRLQQQDDVSGEAKMSASNGNFDANSGNARRNNGVVQSSPDSNMFGDSASVSGGMGGLQQGINGRQLDGIDSGYSGQAFFESPREFAPNQSGPNQSGGSQLSLDESVLSQSSSSQLGDGEAYLASLEVDFPVRGKEYFFTTPGGELRLSARSVDSNLETRASKAIWILFIAGFVLLLRKVAAQCISRRPIGTAIGTTLAVIVGIAGCACLVSGTLPVFGFIGILVSVVMLASRRNWEADQQSKFA